MAGRSRASGRRKWKGFVFLILLYYLIMLLDYQKEMLLAIIENEPLLVSSKGLGLEYVIASLIEVYLAPHNLVLVINSSKDEMNWIMDYFSKKNIDAPKIINGESTAKERAKIYLTGGVVFIASRILIFDILSKRFPLDLVTGIIVMQAHSVCETSREAFALNLFRDQNTHAFIVAFSDLPCHFGQGFNTISRFLKNTFIKKLSLWPRFHASVSRTLEKHTVDVVELRLGLSKHQALIQACLTDLINKCVRELIKSCPDLQAYKDQISFDSCLSPGFISAFNEIINQSSAIVGSHARQISNDFLTLRKLLFYLTERDAFDFEKYLNYLKDLNTLALRANESGSSPSFWMLWSDSDNLFRISHERTKAIKDCFESPDSDAHKNLLFELNPKWNSLLDVLLEVVKSSPVKHEEHQSLWKILIISECQQSASNIEKLANDTHSFLRKVVRGGTNSCNFPQTRVGLKRKVNPESEKSTTCHSLDQNNEDNDIKRDICDSLTLDTSYVGKCTVEVLGGKNHLIIQDRLRDFCPDVVVIYDVCLEWIRTLEIYKAWNPGKALRVYMMLHQNSFEEQKYLLSLKNEKEAFERIIQEKACMVLPSTEKEVDSNNYLSDLIDPSTIQNKPAPIKNDQNLVITDFREFGSDLPFALHKNGLIVIPKPLEIGDYILTPSCAIERKSVSDLVGSLNNGRLYEQAKALSRTYPQSYILIEFNNDNGFRYGISCRNERQLRSRSSPSFYVQSKLLLLILHCPSLRLLWSPSSDYSSKLFQELKKGEEEPDADVASTVSSFENINEGLEHEKNKSYDHLLLIPGVNKTNVSQIINKAPSLIELAKLSKQDLESCSIKNDELLDFLHLQISTKA